MGELLGPKNYVFGGVRIAGSLAYYFNPQRGGSLNLAGTGIRNVRYTTAERSELISAGSCAHERRHPQSMPRAQLMSVILQERTFPENPGMFPANMTGQNITLPV